MSGEDRNKTGIDDGRVCQFHERRESDLQFIRSAVDKHSGQWRMLLIMIGFFVSVSLGLVGVTYKTQEEMQRSVASLDKTVSMYISQNRVETDILFEKIEGLDARVNRLEK